MVRFAPDVFVQVVLESLPVSSSGHVKLCTYLISNSSFIMQGQLSQALNSLVHVPTVLIFFVWYARKWNTFFQMGEWQSIVLLLFHILAADMVTFAIDLMQTHLFSFHIPLSVGFFLSSCALLSLYRLPVGTKKRLGFGDALFLGLLQAFALLPGVSRLALVYAGARWRGYTEQRAFGYAWLLLMPLIVGACVRDIVSMKFSLSWSALVASGFVPTVLLALIPAYAAFMVTFWCVQTKNMWWFGLYLFIPCLTAVLLGI